MIGGGVLNFGQIFGPIAAGMLMALWMGLLIRWWQPRKLSGLEVRGFEPLAFSLRTRRSTN